MKVEELKGKLKRRENELVKRKPEVNPQTAMYRVADKDMLHNNQLVIDFKTAKVAIESLKNDVRALKMNKKNLDSVAHDVRNMKQSLPNIEVHLKETTMQLSKLTSRLSTHLLVFELARDYDEKLADLLKKDVHGLLQGAKYTEGAMARLRTVEISVSQLINNKDSWEKAELDRK